MPPKLETHPHMRSLLQIERPSGPHYFQVSETEGMHMWVDLSLQV